MILNPIRSGGGGLGVDHWQTDRFTPGNGQTAFTLTATSVDSDDVRMRVNGVSYDNGTDYTVAGTSVTWTDAAFTLQLGDVAEFSYSV